MFYAEDHGGMDWIDLERVGAIRGESERTEDGCDEELGLFHMGFWFAVSSTLAEIPGLGNVTWP